MKKFLIPILSMALCLTITACSSDKAVNADDIHENSSSSASEIIPETEDTPAEKPAGAVTDTSTEADKSDHLADMYNVYADALENLLQNQILPDGTQAEGDMAQGKFALYDVDNDGKKELLFMNTNTYMAAQAEYVFKYDPEAKKLQTEFSEFPALTFYDNGIIKAEWSHNQGLAGDNFWPYSLYQYAPETDSYVLVGMVDAWDKNRSKTDYQNNPFPSEIDKSGTGIVYYIMKDGQYDTTHPVDISEYNTWINAYIGNASEIQIQYMDMTEDNISQVKKGL